ncbi:unnamed protein product, partial [Meganyctiphanes norvegica]
DESWYRAACLSPDVSSAQVIFVDYGNIAHVLHEDIRPMDPKLLQTPLMALHCNMMGVDFEGITPKCIEAFKHLLPVETVTVVSVLSYDPDNATYTINIPDVLENLKKQGLID